MRTLNHPILCFIIFYYIINDDEFFYEGIEYVIIILGRDVIA